MLLRPIFCSRVVYANFNGNPIYQSQNYVAKSVAVSFSSLTQIQRRWDSQPKPKQQKNILQKSKFQFQLQQHRKLLCCTAPLLGKSASSGRDKDSKDFLVKGDKVLKIKLKSIRLDAVLKVALGTSKNKIDKAFYEDKVRVNGERARKKSQMMMEGDEIDLIKGPNELNPDFLDVSRVEVIKIGSHSKGEEGDDDGEDDDEDDPDDYRIPAMLKSYKSLTIQNYRQAFKKKIDE